MDQFEVFHRILTQSNPSSMVSMATQACRELAGFSQAEVVAYYAVHAGGMDCLAACDAFDNEIVDLQRNINTNLVQQVSLSGNLQTQTLNLNDLDRTQSLSKRQHVLAVPILSTASVTGVWYIARSTDQMNYSENEIGMLKHLCKDIGRLIQNTRSMQETQYELDTTRSELEMNRMGIMGDHPSMVQMFEIIKKLARVPSTVLIHGESGTGKELVAGALYKLGNYDGPLISLNCGSVEPNLLKSELFGHTKGSFTGALKDRPGLFKRAENGILFLDELGEMPLDMQVTLLRTLECGEIHPVGADEPQQVQTRIVCATHRDLRKMVTDGKFRNDLRQRLKGLTIRIPPLRDRRSDILPLAEYFVTKYNERLGLTFKGLRKEAKEQLMQMDFRSGNVRELEHTIERAMVFEDDPDFITEKYLEPHEDDREESGHEVGLPPKISGGGTFEEQMSAYASILLKDAIEKSKGNKTKAMKRLGLSRTTFYSLLNRHGIN